MSELDHRVQYDLGDIVYLKIDPATPAMVTAIIYRVGCVMYELTWERGALTNHFDIELTKEQQYIIDKQEH